MARRRDVAPGRVLPDAAMVSAVHADPANEGGLLELPVFRGRANRKLVAHWFGALARGRAVPENELPLHSKPGDGPPPVNRWADRDPAAATRLQAARAALAELSAKYSVPVVSTHPLPRPGPPDHVEPAGAARRRRRRGGPPGRGAREWQIELTVDLLTEAVGSA